MIEQEDTELPSCHGHTQITTTYTEIISEHQQLCLSILLLTWVSMCITITVLPQVRKVISTHTSRSRKHKVPNKMKTNRSTPRHIIRCQKFKVKRNHRSSEIKASSYVQGIPIRLSDEFSAEFADQEGMTGYIQWAKRKKSTTGIHYQQDYDSKLKERASLVAQWLRIRLPKQGTRVRALVQDDPTCRGATKPVHHNY